MEFDEAGCSPRSRHEDRDEAGDDDTLEAVPERGRYNAHRLSGFPPSVRTRTSEGWRW